MNIFIETKNNVDKINMPNEFRPMFSDMLSDLNEFFSNHPNINIDFNKLFNDYLYKNFQIVIDEKILKEHGAVGLFNKSKECIFLKNFDPDPRMYEYQKEILTHEFVHFIIFNTYEKYLTTWADEAFTELSATMICKSNKPTGYFDLISLFDNFNTEIEQYNIDDFFNGKMNEYLDRNKLFHLNEVLNEYAKAFRKIDYKLVHLEVFNHLIFLKLNKFTTQKNGSLLEFIENLTNIPQSISYRNLDIKKVRNSFIKNLNYLLFNNKEFCLDCSEVADIFTQICEIKNISACLKIPIDCFWKFEDTNQKDSCLYLIKSQGEFYHMNIHKSGYNAGRVYGDETFAGKILKFDKVNNTYIIPNFDDNVIMKHFYTSNLLKIFCQKVEYYSKVSELINKNLFSNNVDEFLIEHLEDFYADVPEHRKNRLRALKPDNLHEFDKDVEAMNSRKYIMNILPKGESIRRINQFDKKSICDLLLDLNIKDGEKMYLIYESYNYLPFATITKNKTGFTGKMNWGAIWFETSKDFRNKIVKQYQDKAEIQLHYELGNTNPTQEDNLQFN